MMENLDEVIRGQCDELQHIKWVADHVNLYAAVGYGEEILKKMQKYGGNIYTYPEDAIAVYQEFEQHLQKNPYRYLVAFKKEADAIYATEIDGYLIKVDDLVLTIGFLKANAESNGPEAESAIKKFLEECLKEIQTEEKPYVRDIEDALNRSQEYIQNKRNELRAGNKDVYLGILLNVALVLGVGVFVIIGFRTAMSVWMIGLGFIMGAIVEASFLKKMVRATKILKEIERMSDYQQQLQQYYKEYTEMQERYYMNWDALACEETGSLLPCKEWSQFQDILQNIQDMEAASLQKLQVISFQHQNLKVFVICAAYILSAVSMVYYQQYRQRKNEEAARLEREAVLVAEEARKAEEEAELQEEREVFDNEGFIFGDSDTRLLTEEELYRLQGMEDYDFKTLLGFARNEIYARHGYEFNDEGIYYPHYMQYEWYSGMSRKIVNDTDLNEYEIANRNLIVSVEEREGFR